MCMYLPKGVRAKHAKEDIVCYKVVRRYRRIREDKQVVLESFDTPYQNQTVKLNETYDESAGQMDIRNLKSDDEWAVGEHTRGVYGGAFHSYKCGCNAAHDALDWGFSTGGTLLDFRGKPLTEITDHIVVKCIIPKGAKYYEGTVGIIDFHNGEYPEGYASDKLMYTDTIYPMHNDEGEETNYYKDLI